MMNGNQSEWRVNEGEQKLFRPDGKGDDWKEETKPKTASGLQGEKENDMNYISLFDGIWCD